MASVLDTAREAGDVEVEVLALEALARARAERGEIGEARAALDLADGLMPSARHLLSDSDRIDRDAALEALSG
jgi:thiamine monophosphate kinase